MQEVWEAIKQGADAYLSRQLRSILPFIGLLTIALFLSVYIVPPSREALQRFPGMDENSLKLLIGFRSRHRLYHGRRFQSGGRSDRHAHGGRGQRAWQPNHVRVCRRPADCPTVPAPSPAC
ncbi:hypothetical protein [Candidatus Amarolinea dominans]|uniref:hypothetical protein n=1 Tax=Candidatus Amarolinea dominans TaxID=3140696 RepID=UPI0031CCAA4A